MSIDRGYTHIESIVCSDRGDWFAHCEKVLYEMEQGLTKSNKCGILE